MLPATDMLIMKEDSTVLKKEIRGGKIGIGADGTPNGYLADIQQHMLSSGYTMYTEGWGNYFVNTNYYKAAQKLDEAGKLHFVLGLSYEIES